jgi:hypothetical protein
MSEMQFMIGGELLTADALKRITPKSPKRPKASSVPETVHRGWRVLGHPPGAMESAQAWRESEIARWLRMSESDNKAAKGRGEREPKPWDEAEWRRTTTKKAVRSKPYEIPAAAEACAELASRVGWIDIETRAITKGEPQA